MHILSADKTLPANHPECFCYFFILLLHMQRSISEMTENLSSGTLNLAQFNPTCGDQSNTISRKLQALCNVHKVTLHIYSYNQKTLTLVWSCHKIRNAETKQSLDFYNPHCSPQNGCRNFAAILTYLH